MDRRIKDEDDEHGQELDRHAAHDGQGQREQDITAAAYGGEHGQQGKHRRAGGHEARPSAADAGLDGKLWHLRPSVGSATRLITTGGEDNRHLGIQLRLDLRGVPPYLAPTREQWFDPREAGGS